MGGIRNGYFTLLTCTHFYYLQLVSIVTIFVIFRAVVARHKKNLTKCTFKILSRGSIVVVRRMWL